MRRRFTSVLEGLPATVPFLAPEAIERQDGRPLRLRLGANESAFGSSPHAREAMRRAVEELAWYGDPDSFELRTRLAAAHQARVDNVIVASGIDDLLGMIVRAFIEPGDGVVASHGSYPTFAYHVRAYGGVLHTAPYREDRNDPQALVDAAARTAARLLYVANPDNPTGTLLDAAGVVALADALPRGCTLVLDEAYADFVPPGERPAVAPDDPRVLRLRTFSKAHGLAGARIGYGVAAAETIATFEKFRLHFGVSRVAQAGALASLEDTEFVAQVVAAVERGRAEYAALGRELGLPTLPSHTNFVSFDAGGEAQARALLERLRAEGVFVRMPGVAPLSRCIRVTVGAPDERAAFADTLRRIRAHGPRG
jgi:histidinol-phosphate aminotransferase